MLIDSHAHLNFEDYAGKLDQVITDAKAAGVEKIVNIATSLKDSQEAIELAKKYDGMYATVGIHPNDNTNLTVGSIDWEEFERLARFPKVVAIGECGLDYSRIKNEELRIKNHEKERQKKLFQKQIEIAQKLNLPLSIHIREAQNDLMARGNQYSIYRYIEYYKSRGVFHCFSGNQQYLEFILEKLPSFYISFAGNVTFKNAKQLQELAKLVALERLLVETDCPFLSPEPLRGKQNTPANVRITAEKLAEIKGVSFEELAENTTKNASNLFGI